MDLTNKRATFGLLAALLWPAAASIARPYVPSEDDTVLLVVPPPTAARVSGRITALEAAHKLAPTDADVAAALAALHMDRGRRLDDPRAFGVADALLLPFSENAPLVVRRARAGLRSYMHDFAGALRDLDAVLDAAPDDVDARLSRSQLLLLGNRVDDASADCQALAGHTSDRIQALCLAGVDVQVGRCDDASSRLDSVAKDQTLPPEIQAWALELLALARAGTGDYGTAERALREALSVSAYPTRLTATLADVLLASGRHHDVVALIPESTTNLGLGIRRLAASARANLVDPSARALKDRVKALLDDEVRRDATHERERALFMLKVENAPEAALAAAEQNWKSQKEPYDAALLAAAGGPRDARRGCSPPLDW